MQQLLYDLYSVHQLESCIVITKAKLTWPLYNPVQVLFLSRTGVPEALPCHRPCVPEPDSFFIFCLDCFQADVATAWTRQPDGHSAFDPNCPRHVTRNLPLSKESTSNLHPENRFLLDSICVKLVPVTFHPIFIASNNHLIPNLPKKLTLEKISVW